jgi:hypothetical protein
MSSTSEITEATAIVRARALVQSCGVDVVPVDINKFLATAKADLQFSDRMAAGTSGMTVPLGERNRIVVNSRDPIERQRFTALHEIAHIVLNLPSKHGDDTDSTSLFSYARRPPEEILCDIFAAECLLPLKFLEQDLRSAVAGFEFVGHVARKYQASLSCTASRIAYNAPFACAYVLSQEGFVRFSACSQALRASRFFISPRIQVPTASITGQCLATGQLRGSGQVAAHIWTNADGFADVDLMEETRTGGSWNQALTLLWLDDGDVPDDRDQRRPADDREADEPLLRELDGKLPWPGRKLRR